MGGALHPMTTQAPGTRASPRPRCTSPAKPAAPGSAATLLAALEEAAAADGRYKLIAKIFDTNQPSLRLFERAGYTIVGTHLRHGRLDGEWKDVIVLEKLIGPAA